MDFNHKIKKKPVVIIVAIILMVIFCIWQNNSIVISSFIYISDKVPDTFNGFRILQISDLHNKNFGRNQSYLVKKVKEASPDIIVITGDLIDSRRYNLDTAMCFIQQAVEVAPVYYVSGNHEARTGRYEEIKSRLQEAGVIVLDNDSVICKVEGSSIRLIGLKDPNFFSHEYLDGSGTRQMETYLDNYKDSSELKILLSHRPELIYMYKNYNADIVFSGHAHGGQIRLPLVGGLVAPKQGLFPKYDGGEYTEEGTTMYVSRGLGNSLFPLRLFNRPELIVVTIKNMEPDL